MNGIAFKLLFQEGDASFLFIFCLIAFMGGVLVLGVASAIRLVPEYARMAIFRLGRFVGVRGPGLMILIPFIDRGIQVDLREKTEKIMGDVTTQDNTRLTVQMSLRYRIVEPEKSILNIPDLASAVQETGLNRLKSRLGEMTYGNVLHDRSRIEMDLQHRLAEAMKLWGCEVLSVEMTEITRN